MEHLTRLVVLIAAAAAATQPRPAPLTPATPLPVDVEGHRYLPRPRRPLPAGSARALAAVPVDASAAAFTVLLGAVRARWHLADVAAVLHQPGLEHLRTERDPAGRRPRDLRTRQRMLARQWNKAVLAMHRTADLLPAALDDPTFPGRAAAIAALIAAVQARADAAPGRWNTRTCPAGRRVLDALCLLTATAVTATVEADTRRLAMLTGLGRETVRIRLRQLTGDGWITLTEPAVGRRGHIWTITPVLVSPGHNGFPQSSLSTRSQGVPPPGPCLAHRFWKDKLARRLADQNHDIFTPAGFGHDAGQLYTQIAGSSTSLHDLHTAAGIQPERMKALLADLVTAGLVVRSSAGWRRAQRDLRSAAAKRLGCAGVLETRRRGYLRERVLWGWWCDEVEWMRLPRTDPAKRRRPCRVAAGQLSIDGAVPRGRYPRRGDGRADYAAAARFAA